MLGCGSAMLPHFFQEKQMKISNNGLELIKHFEGCVLTAYKCPAGVWTIGYGHTKDVQPGDEWSESHADHMLK